MVERLFVYGSLAPGRQNHHLLDDIPGQWDNATAKGTLHETGWGATMGYPAIMLDAKGTDITGFLFTSEELSQHWNRLDAFEGESYRRVTTPVELNDGSVVEAHVYELNCR